MSISKTQTPPTLAEIKVDNALNLLGAGLKAMKENDSNAALILLSQAKDAMNEIDSNDLVKTRSDPEKFARLKIVANSKYALLMANRSIGGAGGGGGGGGGDNNTNNKQATFDCEEEVKIASRLSSINLSNLIGMGREKLLMNLAFIQPFLYPFLFAAGKGVLMYGPPGTGKTVLANAVVAELQSVLVKDHLVQNPTAGNQQFVYFFSLTGSSLKGMYVGQTEKNIEAAWNCAQQVAEKAGPFGISVIFLDEMETLGGKRNAGDGGLNTSVTSLLQAIDGSQKRDRVRVIGATNRPWDLDEAILSRFPIKVFVDTPGDNARRQLILSELQKFYTQGTPAAHVKIDRMLSSLDNLPSSQKNAGHLVHQLVSTAVNYCQEFGNLILTPSQQEAYCKVWTKWQKDHRTDTVSIQKNDPIVASIRTFFNHADKTEEKFRELAMEPIPIHPDAKLANTIWETVMLQPDRLLDQLVEATGMNRVGIQKLQTSLTEEQYNTFMKSAGKNPELNQRGRSEVGFSNRDLVNLIQQAIRIAGDRVLKTAQQVGKDGKRCRLTCEGESACKVCELSREDRVRIRAHPLTASDFTQAFQNTTASIGMEAYIQYVQYSFQSEQVVKSEQKVTSYKNDSSIAQGIRAYLTMSHPETVGQWASIVGQAPPDWLVENPDVMDIYIDYLLEHVPTKEIMDKKHGYFAKRNPFEPVADLAEPFLDRIRLRASQKGLTALSEFFESNGRRSGGRIMVRKKKKSSGRSLRTVFEL